MPVKVFIDRIKFYKIDQEEDVFISSTVPKDLISDKIPRISSCELEMDVDCKGNFLNPLI